MIQKLIQWLQTFPQWEGTIFPAHSTAVPVNAGLYPTGMEEISRKTDLLGRVRVQNRQRFTLSRIGTAAEENAQGLLQVQNGVQRQGAAGLAPTFGDDPQTERLRAENGKLQHAKQAGTERYQVQLIAEFTKIYENEGET